MKLTSSTKNFPVVFPYTLKGKCLVFLLKVAYKIVGFFNAHKWQTPPDNFEENPAYYKTKHKYFVCSSNKYYNCI